MRRRYEGKHNVQKQNTGTRDRVSQEVVIRGNPLPLQHVPKYAFAREYLKISHNNMVTDLCFSINYAEKKIS